MIERFKDGHKFSVVVMIIFSIFLCLIIYVSLNGFQFYLLRILAYIKLSSCKNKLKYVKKTPEYITLVL